MLYLKKVFAVVNLDSSSHLLKNGDLSFYAMENKWDIGAYVLVLSLLKVNNL